MIYNDFKGKNLSRLGFGCMRFAVDPETGEIDQDKVDAMFDLAIEAGVNYFDTAYPYLDGKSELAMAKALSKYPRDSYYIADKFPGHSLPGVIDNIALFNVSLQKCNTDYFDFYLLHNLTEYTVDIYESEEYHIIPDMLRMKEEGKIKHFGISVHGSNDLLRDFLKRHEDVFDFVQIQMNYLDWTLQNAKEKYEIITDAGLAVWVMEPCRGGKLARLSEADSLKLKQFHPDASDASYAFRFVQGLPNVKMILSGMNEVFQVEDNLKTFEKENLLSAKEQEVLFEIAEGMKNGVPCTACRYCCAGCPMGLDIPMLIDCYNTIKIANNMNMAMRIESLGEEKRPGACVGCGKCAKACPQGIDVPAVMEEFTKIFEKHPKWRDVSTVRQGYIIKDLHM